MVSPYINRFLQPDTIIPDLSNPQSWNRYSYVTNRPVNFSDPSGHRLVENEFGGGCSTSGFCPGGQPPSPEPIEPEPPVFGQAGGGTHEPNEDGSNNPLGLLLDVANNFNYNYSPSGPITLFDGTLWAGLFPFADLQIDWTPSLTVNNGSPVTIGSNGITYGPPPTPFAPRIGLTGNGPSIGFIDSPIFNNPALSGISIPFPQMGQIKMSATAIRQSPDISYVSRIDVTYTSRPDYGAAAAVPIVGAAWYFARGMSGSIGQGCTIPGTAIPC